MCLQSKAKAEKNQAMEHSMSENSCQLCAVEKLTFEPPPIYCTPCGARIKRNAMYYTVGAGDTRHYFCIPCYNESRGDTILAEGTPMPKARLEKKKNDEETEEWVKAYPLCRLILCLSPVFVCFFSSCYILFLCMIFAVGPM
jgi:E1A/CREB-binding protein